MLTVYVVLDGFDLGAGAIHLLVAKTDEQRRQVLASVGPVWDGNEVWLIAAGGNLYFAFPALYASGFSGFYLPIMIVLWLLILRGSSIEFRNHIKSKVWNPLWDFVFFASSLLLTVFFGAALANVVRGVPLDASGYFFEPLWTNFQLGDEVGILDWYTILVGVFALAAVTFKVQPQLRENLTTLPLGLILPLLAVVGLAGVQFELIKRDERKAFFASCLYITGMLTSVVFGVFPMVLPARNPIYSLTVNGAKASDYGLKVGLIWWVVGMMLAAGYFIFVYRSFAGKVSVEKDRHGHGY